jgi:hypothetical protein
VTVGDPFDTTDGTNLQPQSPAEAGVDNVIVVDDPSHTNGSTLDGVGGTNTVAFGSNVNYDMEEFWDIMLRVELCFQGTQR